MKKKEKKRRKEGRKKRKRKKGRGGGGRREGRNGIRAIGEEIGRMDASSISLSLSLPFVAPPFPSSGHGASPTRARPSLRGPVPPPFFKAASCGVSFRRARGALRCYAKNLSSASCHRVSACDRVKIRSFSRASRRVEERRTVGKETT